MQGIFVTLGVHGGHAYNLSYLADMVWQLNEL